MKDDADPLATGIKDYIDVLEGKKPAARAQVGGEFDLNNDQRQRLPYIVAVYRQPCTICGAEPPCAKFLPFKTDNPVTPWIIAGVCKDCATMDNVKYRLLNALREGAE